MPVGKSRIDGAFIEVFGLVANDGVGIFRTMKESFIFFMPEGTTGYSAQFSMKTLLLCFELRIIGAILAECMIISADSIPHECAFPPMLARLDAF